MTAAKKPDFTSMVDHITDPKISFTEDQDQHEERIKNQKSNKAANQSDSAKTPPVERLTKRANFLLKPSIHERLKIYSQQNFVSMNKIVNGLIEDFLKDHNNE